MKDYIIVGAGLAGISFAETLLNEGKTFTVINDASQNSSRVAAGLYNPVILKRLSMPVDAAQHLGYCSAFYKNIEQKLRVKFDYNVPILRKFSSVEEQNNWFQAADKPALSPYLSTTIIHTKHTGIDAPHGYGEVLHTGYVDTITLLDSYQQFLRSSGLFIDDTFNHEELIIEEAYVEYKGIKAKHIVFAEGFGMHANPFFYTLPLNGTKGELLLIKAPGLSLDKAVNAGIFILPFGDGLFKVGATYEWQDKTSIPTGQGRKELVEKLEEVITCDYEIIDHYAGIRPTVKDRKPLIGTHPEYKRLHLLNGLGTRGVLLGPPMAKLLFESIENGAEIDKAVNLSRFIS